MALPTTDCFKGLDLRDQITAIYEALYIAADDTSLTSPECFRGEDSRDQLTDIFGAIVAASGVIPVPSFDPLLYGDLFFRTRIQDQGLANNDPISTSVDTVNANNLTSAGAARPTFQTSIFGSKAGARFSGAQILESSNFPASVSQPYTIAVAFRSNVIATFAAVFDGGAGGRTLCYINNNLIQQYAGNFLGAGSPPLQDSGHTLVVYSNGAGTKVWIDNVEVISGNGGAQALEKFVLGNAFDSGAPFTGDIAEAIIWQGDIGAAGRLATKNYFVSEYMLNGGYTIVDTTSGGSAVRYLIPDVRVAGTGIVYCHGLGENSTTLSLASDKVLYMLDALAEGYMISGGYLGGDQWSNSTAETLVESVVADMLSVYGVTDLVLWSQSAGGALGLMMSTQGFTGTTVHGWFGIYPVASLAAAHANAALTGSVNSAFPSYPADAVGRDPLLIAAVAYNGLRLRCCQSNADTITPKPDHGDPLAVYTTGHALENTCVATVGEHGDASNFTQARADDFISFLGRCL